MSISTNLAENLKAIRTAKKKSLTDFAEELCISRSSLQTILNGDSNLQISTLNQIASCLQTDSLTLIQNPYTSDQLSNATLLLDVLEAYRQLSEEDRKEAARLFHQLITLIDKASDQ